MMHGGFLHVEECAVLKVVLHKERNALRTPPVLGLSRRRTILEKKNNDAKHDAGAAQHLVPVHRFFQDEVGNQHRDDDRTADDRRNGKVGGHWFWNADSAKQVEIGDFRTANAKSGGRRPKISAGGEL